MSLQSATLERPEAGDPGTSAIAATRGDLAAFIRSGEAGISSLHLMVEGVHCGGCIKRIERTLSALPGVVEARLNFTTRRLTLRWTGGPALAGSLVEQLTGLGYQAIPFDPEKLKSRDAEEEKSLLRALAVAGFAAANIMLLSVAVWAGHAQGMETITRDLMHWVSALIAFPAIAYAGQPFFRSALGAIKAGHANMDLPISLAVCLAAGVSLQQTMMGGPHVYFDSSVSLLFFLLIGRYLDRRARGRARSAAERLLALAGEAVTLLLPDGRQKTVAPDQVCAGQTVLVAAGERIGIDGRILDGRSDVETSLITGETLPAAVGPGDLVYAGTLNQAAPLKLTVTAVGEATLLAEIVRLMELAEQRKARFVEIAERVARLYAPAVHLLALVAFLGWAFLGGLAWPQALMIAVSVLIITCPCALGLAVPAVQVLASGRLMRKGILLKSGSALERLAKVDTLVFDKTGTLTLGRPELCGQPEDAEALALAATLAGGSRHPLAQALFRAAAGAKVADGLREFPGQGLLLETEAGEIRLGSRDWCGVENGPPASGPELWLARPDRTPQRFQFRDALRPDAAETIAALQAQGFEIALLSGDRPETVAAVAAELGIETWRGGQRPDDKVAALEALSARGRQPAMIGDGLNDAPALAAALVSISPSSAADISQNAADAVFQGERLAPVAELIAVARFSERLVKQNLALSFAYNILTVPLAMAGLVTPLIAAVSMSASSLLVVGNSLRLGWRQQDQEERR